MQYQFANGIYGQLLGYEADELLGRDVRETVHPADLASYTEQSERFSQGIGYSFRITMRARGGQPQQLVVQTAPILSEGVFQRRLRDRADRPTPTERGRERDPASVLPCVTLHGDASPSDRSPPIPSRPPRQ